MEKSSSPKKSAKFLAFSVLALTLAIAGLLTFGAASYTSGSSNGEKLASEINRSSWSISENKDNMTDENILKASIQSATNNPNVLIEFTLSCIQGKSNKLNGQIKSLYPKPDEKGNLSPLAFDNVNELNSITTPITDSMGRPANILLATQITGREKDLMLMGEIKTVSDFIKHRKIVGATDAQIRLNEGSTNSRIVDRALILPNFINEASINIFEYEEYLVRGFGESLEKIRINVKTVQGDANFLIDLNEQNVSKVLNRCDSIRPKPKTSATSPSQAASQAEISTTTPPGETAIPPAPTTAPAPASQTSPSQTSKFNAPIFFAENRQLTQKYYLI